MSDTDPLQQQKIVYRRVRRTIRISRLISIVSACVLFACAGFCFLSPFIFGAQQFEGDAGAKKVAGEIVDWKPPTSFEGLIGITVDNMMFRLDIARYTHHKGRGTLVIARSLWRTLHPQAKLEARQQLIEQVIEWVRPDLREIDARDTVTRQLHFRDLSGECQTSHGEDRGSTTKYRQVTGFFHDEKTDVYFALQCEEEFLTEQEIEDFLNSVK